MYTNTIFIQLYELKKRKSLVANQKLIHMSEDAERIHRKMDFFMSIFYTKDVCYTPNTNINICSKR